MMFYIWLQLIEKDNARLEAEMKDILMELNLQKDHSNSMHAEIARLEMSLSHSKVFKTSFIGWNAYFLSLSLPL